MSQELHFAVSQFLYKKAELCDAYDWDAYLELYDEDSEYHHRHYSTRGYDLEIDPEADMEDDEDY